MPADAAIVGTAIRTLDPGAPVANAIAWADGRIVAVGDHDVRAACDASTEIVDGHGATVTPGLIDGHQHLFMGSRWRRGVDLTGIHDLDEIRARLRAGRAAVGSDAWLIGYGAEYEPWQHEPYHWRRLDGADGSGPLLLWSFDLHSAFVNAAALRRAGVTGARRLGDQARIVCGPDGVPTGELREWSAINLVADVIAPPSREQERDWLVETLAAQHAVGLTGQHLMDGSPSTAAELAALEADGELTQRVWLHQFVYADTDDDEFAAILDAGRARGRLWRADGAKFMLDGVIDTGTGWLLEPDTHGGGTEPMWRDVGAYDRRVGQLHRAGLRVATHATGDGAVAHALTTYAALPGGAGRHRVEHIETAPDAVVAGFAPAGVTASMQPVAMQWVRADRTDPWSARLDPHRCAHGWRGGDLTAGGALVVLGSDWPVAHFDPRLGFYAARRRRGPDAEDPRPIGTDRPLTGPETLAGYTVHAARATGDDAWLGRLVPGAAADLVLWAADPVTTAPEEFLDVPALLTVVAGRVVHRAR